LTTSAATQFADAAADALSRHTQNVKDATDERRTAPQFKIGDHVWVACRAFSIGHKAFLPKMARNFCGPFRVTSVHSPLLYGIGIPDDVARLRSSELFHAEFLEPCHLSAEELAHFNPIRPDQMNQYGVRAPVALPHFDSDDEADDRAPSRGNATDKHARPTAPVRAEEAPTPAPKAAPAGPTKPRAARPEATRVFDAWSGHPIDAIHNSATVDGSYMFSASTQGKWAEYSYVDLCARIGHGATPAASPEVITTCHPALIGFWCDRLSMHRAARVPPGGSNAVLLPLLARGAPAGAATPPLLDGLAAPRDDTEEKMCFIFPIRLGFSSALYTRLCTVSSEPP
jgi:hypothetical protein